VRSGYLLDVKWSNFSFRKTKKNYWSFIYWQFNTLTAREFLSTMILYSSSQSMRYCDWEADAMLIVHLMNDVFKRGLRTYFICNADTDVVVTLYSHPFISCKFWCKHAFAWHLLGICLVGIWQWWRFCLLASHYILFQDCLDIFSLVEFGKNSVWKDWNSFSGITAEFSHNFLKISVQFGMPEMFFIHNESSMIKCMCVWSYNGTVLLGK